MTPQDDLMLIVNHLPNKPGVYRFIDAQGTLLYVGKAKDLRKRVKSYFQKTDHTPRIAWMVSQVANIDTTVTATEVEALLLESNQIKALKPRFNVLLRHDSHYPWLAFTNEPFPRLVVTRKPNANYWRKLYGPYPSAGAMYQTLKVIKKIFPLRQRRTPLFRDRPCMNYHIGQCLAPCVGGVSAADYDAMVEQVEQFLKGRTGDVLVRLEADMAQASAELDFERAALLRDRIEAIELVVEQQRVIVNDEAVDEDVVACALHDDMAQMTVMTIRQGKLVNTHFFPVSVPADTPRETVFGQFLTQYYRARETDPDRLPKVLISQVAPEDSEVLLDWLSGIKGHRVKLRVPKSDRGTDGELVAMAAENARQAMDRWRLEAQTKLARDPVQALMGLQAALHLPRFPKRIECYDISHVGGTHTVASMVVFTDGVPDKGAYRRFKIKTTEAGKPDDFKSMAEVMARRFKKQAAGGDQWPVPDLVVIDGGKGQLSAAVKALAELDITDQPIVSLAKKFEELFLPGHSRPVVLERHSPTLQLVQQLRDEAHRFAITYHRQLRGKAQTASWLDDVPGIGPVRKQKLQVAFSSRQAILAASVEEVAAAIGVGGKTAQKVYEAIRQALTPSP
ncbi:MAG: excinuclease ABC subunit UvrC [Vampirovibrionales bacterium]